jgi:hypothetical protein
MPHGARLFSKYHLNHNLCRFGKVMVYLAFNRNLNARRGRPLLSQWDQTASAQ